MQFRKLAAIAVAGVAMFGVAAGVTAQDMMVDPAIAAMTPEELVEARQAEMKQNGAILKGAGALTGAEAVEAAEKLQQSFMNYPALFGEVSIVGDSKALPLIWEDKEGFDAIAAQAADLAGQMKAAAEAGDMAAYGAAAQQIGASCGTCHKQYRS